uniref:Putative plant transposon protein domain-containing protein n=1 Tax=Solanum tuberosum TaxID=4113 RepID=M1DJS8_SOLTU
MHPKVALLGCILDWEKLNLKVIISQEMVKRVKQNQTSLPFPVLISDLCRQIPPAIVTRDADKGNESDTHKMDEEELEAHDEAVFEDL